MMKGPVDYYTMKRKAQQTIAKGWNVTALLLMDDLQAWWHCPNKERLAAKEIMKEARRRYRRLCLLAANDPRRWK